ncbi:MAG: VWA domain-containing protein, partial [bacterium]
AEPKWGYHWQRVAREGIDIVIAIDTSKSMLARDVKPDRLERAKMEIRELLDVLPGDRVALVAFAGTSYTVCPLTLDYAAVEMFLKVIKVGVVPLGGTDIGGAIEQAIRIFKGDDRNYRALIVLSDGEDHGAKVEEAAKSAKELGVKIFSVGIGSRGGELIPVESEDGEKAYLKDREGKVVQTRLTENTLERIALMTGGTYVYPSAGRFGLVDLYNEKISRMEKKELGERQRKIYENRFQWPLGIALYDQGNACYRKGEYEEALKNYSEAMTEAPEKPELYFNIGDALYKQSKFPEAIKLYEKTAAAGDVNYQSKVFYNIGNSKFQSGQAGSDLAALKEAAACYVKALDLNPGDVDAKYNLEFVQREIKKIEEQQKQEQKKQEDNKGEEKGQQKKEQEKKDQEKKEQEKKEQEEKEKQQQEQKAEEQEKEDQGKEEERKEQEKEQQEKEKQQKEQQEREEKEKERQEKDRQKKEQGEKERKEKERQGEDQEEQRQGGLQPQPETARAEKKDEQELTERQARELIRSFEREQRDPTNFIKTQIAPGGGEVANDW